MQEMVHKLFIKVAIFLALILIVVASDYDNNELKALGRRVLELEKRLISCESVKHKLGGMEYFLHQLTKRQASDKVAFSALVTTDANNVQPPNAIIFDKVIMNDGNGYNNQTGVFMVPVSGVYLISYVLAKGAAPGEVLLSLKHNGQKVNAAVVDTFHQWQDQQGGNIAILKLSEGDRLWLDAYHERNADLFGSELFTSFSGVRLY